MEIRVIALFILVIQFHVVYSAVDSRTRKITDYLTLDVALSGSRNGDRNAQKKSRENKTKPKAS